MLKNKDATTFHPPPRKESSDQQDPTIDKHRFQILDKSRAKERKTALIICSDWNVNKMQLKVELPSPLSFKIDCVKSLQMNTIYKIKVHLSQHH